jgi:hypothetical protein
VVSRDLVQRLAPTLNAMEAAGDVRDAIGTTILKGMRWSVLFDTTDEDRSVGEGLAGLPSLHELQLAGISTGTPAAAVVATGTGLLGNQTKASLSVTDAAGTMEMLLTAVSPGAPGNAISCDVITPATTLEVTVAANKITVRPASGGSTIADIVIAINAEADALLLVQASTVTGGTLNEAVAEAYLEGGNGPGVSLSANGTALALSEVTDTQLTFAVPSGISTSGYIVPLEYRNGPHVSRLSVPVIA